jgi:MFS family permease
MDNRIMTKLLKSKHNGDKNPDRLLSKDYILVMFSSTGHGLMNQFFLLAMPFYVAKLGGLTVYAGLISMVFAIVVLIARPIAGILSDKYGRVKLLIAGALICTATGAFSTIGAAISLIFVLRAFAGFGFALQSTCAGAAAADILPASRIAEGIGYFGLYSTLAQAAGPAIALAIIAGDTIGDYKTLFIVTTAICFASMIANCCITYERKRKRQADSSDSLTMEVENKKPESKTPEGTAPEGITPESIQPENKKPEIRQPKKDEHLPKTFFGFEYAVFAPVAVTTLVQFAVAGILSYLAPFAKWKGIGDPTMFYFALSAGVVVSRFLFGRVVDKRGSDIIIIPGIALMTVCLALLPSVNSMAALVILALPLGMAQGALLPTFNAMMFRRCSPARRGTASGAYYVAIDGGYVIGAPLLGALVDIWDYRFVYWASAIVTALALALYLLISTDRRFYRKKISNN